MTLVPVDVASMADGEHRDGGSGIIDGVEHAEAADSEPPAVSVHELASAARAGFSWRRSSARVTRPATSDGRTRNSRSAPRASRTSWLIGGGRAWDARSPAPRPVTE